MRVEKCGVGTFQRDFALIGYAQESAASCAIVS